MAKAKKTVEETTPAEEVVVEEVQEVTETPEEPTAEAEATDTEAPAEDEAFTKAGKRSKKAQEEADKLAAKEARKAAGDETPADPEAETHVEKTGPVPIARPRTERHGKKYRELAKKIEADKTYSLNESLKLAIETSPVKFDATVELHIRLGVDPRHADQNIRSNLVLPHGTGTTVRVAVFAPSDKHEDAKKAGADLVGEEDFLEILKKGELDFDILIATPDVMAKLGRFAKVLGPKGLMPNPKSGTVTKNVAQAVKEAKAGRVEYRVDSQGIVHSRIGKVSFGDKKLVENAEALLTSIKNAKPPTIKGQYIETVYVTTAMGPSIRIEL